MSIQQILRKARSLLGIIRTVDNWVTTLTDHLGMAATPYVCKLRSGLRFNIRPGTDDTRVLFEVLIRGCYSRANVPSGAIVVDIGANIGCYSLFAAQRAARVIACEPHPTNLSMLRKNIELNDAQNVEVVPYALTAVTGTRALILPDNDTFFGRYSLYPGRGARSIEVTCITLEDLIHQAGIAKIDLIKIDCQGAEYEILYGLSPDALAGIDQIIVECERFPDHPQWSQSELEAHLRSQGFSVFNQGNLLHAAR